MAAPLETCLDDMEPCNYVASDPCTYCDDPAELVFIGTDDRGDRGEQDRTCRAHADDGYMHCYEVAGFKDPCIEDFPVGDVITGRRHLELVIGRAT